MYLFFTDGISEAMNAADDCFGETRLGRILEDHAHLSSDELRERVRQGDFTHKIAVSSDDQLGELAGSFNQMTASIEDLLIQ